MAANSDLPSAPSGRSWSLVDAAAAAAVVLAAVGVIWSPKLSGALAKATGALTPVTVFVDVRGPKMMIRLIVWLIDVVEWLI